MTSNDRQYPQTRKRLASLNGSRLLTRKEPRGSAIAPAEVIDVADDGLVHVRPLPGPVSPQRSTNASQRV
jgi:hypothetical protein